MLRELGRIFSLSGELVAAATYGDGHINDTYVATYRRDGVRKRYLHQRLNTAVFDRPRAVMENVSLVCEHLNRTRSPEERPLTLLPAVTGEYWWIDEGGSYWRTYDFIEESYSLNVAATPLQAREAARAFGAFQAALADLPADRLHETIPDFHNTRKRFDRLELAVSADSADRLRGVEEELAFARSREPLADRLLALQQSGEVPVRVIHNDTKLNNVLFRNGTDRAISVVDLDTVMPGLSLHDFGDLVRSATNSGAEDARDLSRIHVRTDIFEALVEGFQTGAGPRLTEVERTHLLTAGKVMTFECGIRFLTDYLAGDTYFKTSYEHHNLDRCRAQFQLLRSLEEQSDSLQRIVDAIGDRASM